MPTRNIKISVRKEGSFDLNEKRRKVERNTTIGMRQMIEDIHRTSRPITPKLTGDLRGDVRKTTQKLGSVVRGTIEWKRPYAWYQERGYTSGPVRRYTTPGTRAHFAETSVKKVTSKAKKYFGKKV
tara:strand:- start:2332 stop:2709 length:378 start_codon:yes stop_codon:yes gene_type:complete